MLAIGDVKWPVQGNYVKRMLIIIVMFQGLQEATMKTLTGEKIWNSLLCKGSYAYLTVI